MRRTKRLALELAKDGSLRLGERYRSRNVLRHLCEHADERINCGDSSGLRIAQLAVQLSGRLLCLQRWSRRPEKSPELAMSFARLAAALRLANRLEHAEAALQIAHRAAPSDMKGDILRRRVWLRLYQGRLEEALQDAEVVPDMTSGQAHAVALGTLAGALLYNGRVSEAIAKYRQCLAELDPEDNHRYCSMVVSYTVALADGTEADLHDGLELCAKWRSKLKRQHKMQRAKLWWAQGLIQKRLGQLDKAWWSLDVARRSLVAMEAAPEVAAIIADMAEVNEEPVAIGVLCTEAGGLITAPHPLAKPLQALASAARELIPEAAATLRLQASQLASLPAL